MSERTQAHRDEAKELWAEVMEEYELEFSYGSEVPWLRFARALADAHLQGRHDEAVEMCEQLKEDEATAYRAGAEAMRDEICEEIRIHRDAIKVSDGPVSLPIWREGMDMAERAAKLCPLPTPEEQS